MKVPLFAITLTSFCHADPEGFEMTIFAKPFQVEYPTALTAAADGTVYVSADRNGSLGKDKEVGKVVSCRDTDGDGKADEFFDFVPKIDSPRGGHFVGDTLYLIHPPFLSSFRDTNGDGVSDEHKVLLENIGFGLNHPRGSDHTTNGCRMGIDGWLYIAVGDFGMEGTRGTDGRVVTLHGGGVARVRPDGSQLEVYSYHTRNNCDVAISPYLDMFTRDNTNDGKGWDTRVHHFTNGSEHGYPRLYKNFTSEAVKPLLDVGGGSGTGALYLHEPGFPGEMGDQLYTCDWTTGKIYKHALEPFEASFKAEQEDFMTLARAVDMDVDGESHLYVCDWRGGRFVYAGEGVKVGLVQRLTMPGMKVEAWPDLAKMGDADLVKQVAHRSAVRRLEAQRELLKRGGKPAVADGLVALIKDGELPLYSRVAAIFTFKQLDGAEANAALLENVGDEAIREFVLRAVADRKDQLEGVPSDAFVRGLKDANPRVRLQAVIGLQRLGAKDAASELIALGSETWEERLSLGAGEDYRIPHATVQALAGLEAWEACLEAASDPATRAVALQALQLMHTDEVVSGLENLLVKEEVDESLRFDLVKTLARLFYTEGEWDKKDWWGTRPDDRGPYFLVSEWSGTPKVKTILERAFAKAPKSEHGRLIEVMAKNRIDISALELGERDPLMMALGSTELSQGNIALLTSAALDADRPWEVRLRCYRSLGRGDAAEVLRNRIEILSKWLQEEALGEVAEREVTDFISSPALILEIKTLHQVAVKEDDQMSRIAWRALLSFSQSPLAKEMFREQALKLVKNNPRQVGFFLALQDLKLTGFDEQIAAAIDSDNDTLIQEAKRTKEMLASTAASGGKIVAELDAAEVMKAAMEGKGDVANGATLFNRQGCIACHAIDQAAVQKGPYLGSAGSGFTRDYLIESILDPNAVVAQGFQTELLTLKDGSVKMGFVTRDEDGVLEIRDIAGIATEVKIADIAKRDHQSTSMMPPGLASNLTLGEFVDLVEYLASLKVN
ncbi:heme-binding domain-containing protein [Haloferula chungangensis]|uniref:Heme-binding domain-containing protein n=1 Tax=Haloferula chungangensis TaxID=1048331 RepID=A0ABW2LCV3_9BACT